MIDYAPCVAQQCAAICDSNGDHKSAEDIRKQFFLVKPVCALLAPKVKNDNSSN